MATFFRTLIPNILGSYRGGRWMLHVAAALLTVPLVLVGFDWYWFRLTATTLIREASFPAVALGGLVPVLLPVCIIVIGRMRKDAWLSAKGWLLGQAAVIGLIVSTIYKAFTGRVEPSLSGTVDISRQFEFGFLRHGVFWGWPSSHTTTAFALALAFFFLFRGLKWRYMLLIYALYVGLGVSTTIHWFSEFAAGALIGIAVGMAVGKSSSVSYPHSTELPNPINI